MLRRLWLRLVRTWRPVRGLSFGQWDDLDSIGLGDDPDGRDDLCRSRGHQPQCDDPGAEHVRQCRGDRRPGNQSPAVTMTSPASGAQFTAPSTVSIDGHGERPRESHGLGRVLRGRHPDLDRHHGAVCGLMVGVDPRHLFPDRAGTGCRRRQRDVERGLGHGDRRQSATDGIAHGAGERLELHRARHDQSDRERLRIQKDHWPASNSSMAPPCSEPTPPRPTRSPGRDVAAGSYGLRAVAYDSAGTSASSATANVTVTGANSAPTVSLTSPAMWCPTFTAPAHHQSGGDRG